MANRRRRGKAPRPQQLLVEGQDDQHVVWHLCEQHRLSERFDVSIPGDDDEQGGIQPLLADIPVRLRLPALRTLGIMIDADRSAEARWQSVRDAVPEPLREAIPPTPVANGWVADPVDFYGTTIRVGIWLMPGDDARQGMLEDFALRLIKDDDSLLPIAISTLDEVEQLEAAAPQRYATTHRSKALIHTWLVWQQNPGRPMGTAIKAGYLRHDAPPALAFVAWLRRLFALDAAPEVV